MPKELDNKDTGNKDSLDAAKNGGEDGPKDEKLLHELRKEAAAVRRSFGKIFSAPKERAACPQESPDYQKLMALECRELVPAHMRTKEHVTEVIRWICKLYTERMLPDEVFVAFINGNPEPLKKAILEGGFLFPFDPEQLARDLIDPNYLALGLFDPETDELVSISTAYVPSSEEGRWSITKPSPQQPEHRERDLTCYEYRIYQHFQRMHFIADQDDPDEKEKQRWQRGASKVIGYDTIGVAKTVNGKPFRLPGVGIRTMLETCKKIVERLGKQRAKDAVMVSYRFCHIVHEDGERHDVAISPEMLGNSASGKLFEGWATYAHHTEGKPLQRAGGNFRVIWLDEAQRLMDAMDHWEKRLEARKYEPPRSAAS